MLLTLFVLDAQDSISVPWLLLLKVYSCYLQKSYWSNTGASKEFVDDESDPMQNRNFEPVSRDLKPGIQVRNLKKSFKNVTAVNKVSVNFYQGEITALLGHNGAGKTTTMSMLTGKEFSFIRMSVLHSFTSLRLSLRILQWNHETISPMYLFVLQFFLKLMNCKFYHR